jgi:hypothetical protein
MANMSTMLFHRHLRSANHRLARRSRSYDHHHHLGAADAGAIQKDLTMKPIFWFILAAILALFSPVGVGLKVPLLLPFMGLLLSVVWQLVISAKLRKLGKPA